MAARDLSAERCGVTEHAGSAAAMKGLTMPHDDATLSAASAGSPTFQLRVLDLYCGAGMAADGYAAAGFAPTGVDIFLRASYPYEFVWGSALAILKNRDFVQQFDLIHASPPCQAHTRAKHLRSAQGGKIGY